MILPINEKYRIAGDKYCWSIQKSKRKNGHIIWESINWFQSLEHAVNHLGEMMVRTSDAQTLADALKEIEKVTTLLTHALSPKFKVIPVTNKEKADEYSYL